MSYSDFINSRLHSPDGGGFDMVWIPDFLYPFQSDLVEWAIKQGRSGIFADCGMGKTPIELVWAQNAALHTGGRVMILTPLAVGAQFESEAGKFQVNATRSRTGDLPDSQIVITNYEKLHLFNPKDFAAVVCDESSILKNFSGVRRGEITRFMRKIKYRLLATATAAPNDFTELGTSSEALGHTGHMDMLNKFFKNDLNNSAQGRMRGEVIKWRLKGHAELPFWRWVCSWARAARKPSDLGYSDGDFALPPLVEHCEIVETKKLRDGMMFALPAVGLKEQREERRLSIEERCEKMAEMAIHKAPAIMWCHLNDEGDLLAKLVPDAVQVSGKDSDDSKEAKLTAFQKGEVRALITKPKIGAWGLNFQHCRHVLTFPSHSYEQYYQSIRRCWRFGQTKSVRVDIIATEGEQDVLKNLQAKQIKADEMFTNLVAEMNRGMNINPTKYETQFKEAPWLSSINA